MKKAIAALAQVRLPGLLLNTPSWFVLERAGPVPHVPDVPWPSRVRNQRQLGTV